MKQSKGPIRRILRICLDIFLVCGVIGTGLKAKFMTKKFLLRIVE